MSGGTKEKITNDIQVEIFKIQLDYIALAFYYILIFLDI